MLDIISIGDATEDVFLELEEASLHCNKGTKTCQICMDFATKIPVKSLHKLVGGNAANLAIGARRLGLKSSMYLELGKDEQGEKILRSLKKDHVDTTYVYLKKNYVTNYSVVLNKGAERTILIYHGKRKYKLPALSKAPWVYLTSMGKDCEAVYKPLLKYVEKTKAKLGFNPGTHQLRTGLRKLKPLLKASTVVLLNVEETQFLFKEKSRDIKKLLKLLKSTGCGIAVITDGPAGSYAYDGRQMYYQNIYDVPVVERTGCGDSYSTGFIAALFYGHDIKEAMKWGTVNAAGVIQHIGPQEGLLTKIQLQTMLKKKPRF
ncbi:carbohydrate kinase family protein [Candidatus Woesearchaeota archaeon]|nr:carbohydrate kinase family protein [Candidatus Woesearchaeota archaeon]